MKTLKSAAALVAVMLLAGSLGSAQQPVQNPDRVGDTQNSRVSNLGDGPWEFDTADYRIRVTKMVGNLDRPYGMAWLPDGTMLLTERPGRLRIIRNGVLDPKPIAGVPNVLVKDFDGLEDVKLHPDYAQNKLIYLSYSKPHPADGGGQCALARAQYDGGYELKNVQEIFAGRGASPRHLQQIVTVRLAWGKDGMIYMTCATPNVDRFQAQDPTSHRGKVLRMRDDGSAPPDNPLIGKTDYGLPYNPEIYTTGHRDGMSIAVHPETGQIYQMENGPQAGDELNILKPGANYGWPLISLGREYSGAPINRFMEGMEQPFMFWGPSIAPSSVMFYTGDTFAKWKGNLLVSGLTGSRIERLAFNAQRLPTRSTGGNSEFLLWELRQRIRQVQQGPDGLLYAITDYRNGALLRIEPINVPVTDSARR
jgi:glucose/arabinose dehydrogenase